MSTSFAIVLVAAMIFAVPLLAIWTRRPRQRHRDDDQRDEVLEALETEVLALRERIETLETIVTDERYTLESEFEDLESSNRAGRAVPPRRDRVSI